MALQEEMVRRLDMWLRVGVEQINIVTKKTGSNIMGLVKNPRMQRRERQDLQIKPCKTVTVKQ